MSTSKERVIDIGPDGTVSGLHFEDFPLQDMGKAVIKRATDIKWRTEGECWDIVLLDDNGAALHHYPKHLSGFDGYEAAREHEVAFLQACRVEEVGPISNAGDEVGARLRSN